MAAEIIPDDAVHLRTLFKKFDENGDELICRNEMGTLLKTLGVDMTEEELNSLMGCADHDRDGCLNFREFVNMYKSLCHCDHVEEGDLRKAFDVFDRNGDGFICPGELSKVLLSLGYAEGGCLAECQKMINQVDEDGDGQVNFLEFKKMVMHGSFPVQA
eukprot:Gb_30178 [translate_table: standard]